MGYNISGVVINKSYNHNIEALAKDLGLELEFFDAVSFEEASANWSGDGIADIYFTQNGTLIFMDMNRCSNPYPITGANTMSFILSEMSMTFCINYCEDGKLVRSVVESEDQMQVDGGNKLALELEEDDLSEVIWKQLELMLGKAFWDMDLEEKAYRYMILEPRVKKFKSPKAKPWWKFW